jgi:hypothetical protein
MSFPLPNSQKPLAGPIGIPVSLDFTTLDTVRGDLSLEQMQGMLDYVQAIYIDNSLNTKSLSIIFSGLGYKITTKAGRQGIFPVITQQGGLSWQATSTGSGLVIPVIMFNVQQPYMQWDAV